MEYDWKDIQPQFTCKENTTALELCESLVEAGIKLSDCEPMRPIAKDTLGIYHKVYGHIASWMPKRKHSMVCLGE